MVRLFSVFFTVCLIFPSISYAADIVAESKIEAVTVYNNRAKVTRKSAVDVQKGANTLVFHGLPAILLPDSLRVEGESTADVKFGAVMHKRVVTRDLTSVRERELQTELEKLQDKRSYIDVDQEALRAQERFLQSIGKQASLRTDEAIAELSLQPEQWVLAGQTIQKNLQDILRAMHDKDIEKRELDKEIRRIQSELSQSRTGQRSTYDVTIPLESDKDGNLNVALSYQVPNASWSPIYDARLETEGEDLTLIQYGSVRQNTGEDWTNVKLSLSTAQPHRGTSLPDLHPYWVNLWAPGRQKTMRARSDFASLASNVNTSIGFFNEMDELVDAEMPMMAAGAPVKKEASFVSAEIETGGFVSEYKITGPATVISNGSETKLMVGSFETTSALEIHVKPQLSADAFLVARTKLKGDAPVLPGKLSLFRDGAYVGQAHLPLLRPQGEHVLFFGVDDKVSVKRKTLKDEHKDAGIIMRSNAHERHLVAEIENLHKQSVKLVVKETIPVGQDEKIETEILKAQTTQGYEEDAANIKGMLRWEIPLAAKEKKDLRLGWKVTWPKDHQISGL